MLMVGLFNQNPSGRTLISGRQRHRRHFCVYSYLAEGHPVKTTHRVDFTEVMFTLDAGDRTLHLTQATIVDNN